MQSFHRSQWGFWNLWSLLILGIMWSSTIETSRTQLQDRKFEEKHSKSWSYRITTLREKRKEKTPTSILDRNPLHNHRPLFWSPIDLSMTPLYYPDHMTSTYSGSLRLEKLLWKRRTRWDNRWKISCWCSNNSWWMKNSWWIRFVFQVLMDRKSLEALVENKVIIFIKAIFTQVSNFLLCHHLHKSNLHPNIR